MLIRGEKKNPFSEFYLQFLFEPTYAFVYKNISVIKFVLLENTKYTKYTIYHL